MLKQDRSGIFTAQTLKSLKINFGDSHTKIVSPRCQLYSCKYFSSFQLKPWDNMTEAEKQTLDVINQVKDKIVSRLANPLKMPNCKDNLAKVCLSYQNKLGCF